MKTSVLKASKQAAELLWNQFKRMNEKLGRERFKRIETENGFSITGPKVENNAFVLNENGKRIRVTLFTYEKTEAGPRITWDENAVTI